ncbi:EamA domain-containing membrane protein RarD [Roseibium hamelinense]|uniref:EamA domain-containing membrane protein RarD n=1 Tax=Roseibium hamelinense TaxID=150831 RepID=A0A562SUM6_9HYPH|nr:DMT family transporter [Roseibium hamelinense]MTI43163.1 DMT family transporter [Roseibium hamelinense]TWI84788.1 EamA domain-containing membrane protein RarD [Roseibium hamelinense]
MARRFFIPISLITPPVLSVRAATVIIAATAICFGLVPLFARELSAAGVGPASVALYRYGFSAVLLLPFLPFERRKAGGALLLIGAGAVLGLSWIGYLEAITLVPVAAAGVVYMSYPVFAMVFAWILLNQTPTWQSFAAAGLIVLAAALLLDPGSVSSDVMFALLWAVPAPVAFGFVIVLLSGLSKELSPVERTACGLAGSILGLLPMAFQEAGGNLLPSEMSVWMLVLAMGLLTAVIPQVLYAFACQRVGAMRAAAAGSFELPTMFAVGYLFFGEAIGLREGVSAILVLTAILIAPAVRSAPVPVPNSAQQKIKA